MKISSQKITMRRSSSSTTPATETKSKSIMKFSPRNFNKNRKKATNTADDATTNAGGGAKRVSFKASPDIRHIESPSVASSVASVANYNGNDALMKMIEEKAHGIFVEERAHSVIQEDREPKDVAAEGKDDDGGERQRSSPTPATLPVDSSSTTGRRSGGKQSRKKKKKVKTANDKKNVEPIAVAVVSTSKSDKTKKSVKLYIPSVDLCEVPDAMDLLGKEQEEKQQEDDDDDVTSTRSNSTKSTNANSKSSWYTRSSFHFSVQEEEKDANDKSSRKGNEKEEKEKMLY